MHEFDLVIRGGTVVTAADTTRADVGVRDGRIIAIAEKLVEGRQEIDASGLLVLPGGIDSHVHFAQPSGSSVMADDFESGTRSALAGGNTTVMSFALQAARRLAAHRRARIIMRQPTGRRYCDLRLPSHRHRSDALRPRPGTAGAGRGWLYVVQGVHDLRRHGAERSGSCSKCSIAPVAVAPWSWCIAKVTTRSAL